MDNNKEWFLYVVDHHEGPFSIDEIKKLLKDGEAKTTSYVWKEGFADWSMMTDVTEFGPATANSDGHGPFAFLTRLLPDKIKNAAHPIGKSEAAGPGSAFDPSAMDTGNADAAVATGHDISDVDPSLSCWCLNADREYSGPYSLKNIIRKVNEGQVAVSDSIWKEGWRSFVTISNIPAIMEQVKPDCIDQKNTSKKKSKKRLAAAAASALGLGGKASVAKRRWYQSRFFKTVAFLVIVGGSYQGLAGGALNPLLERIPGAKEKIAAMHLSPLSAEGGFAALESIKTALVPILQRNAGLLPEPLRSMVSVIEIPETVKPNDAETLREAASGDLKRGMQVATALPTGEEFNPAFLIASNAPDGTTFQVILRGKEGTLLNTMEYEKTITVDINRHIGTTLRFVYEGSKPLPKGEYALIAYEADKQTPEVAQVFANIPKKTPPGLIPKDKVAYVIDSYFLGGAKDANYQAKLKEYQQKVKSRLAIEGPELKQLTLLLEQMANDSASKFTELTSNPLTQQTKAAWEKYHANDYAKLSGQVKAVFAKLTPETLKEYALPNLYRKLEQTYGLTERLHQLEDDVVEKGAKADSVPLVAGQVADSIADMKNILEKVTK